MTRLLIALCLSLLASAVGAQTMPNPQLTPGEIRPLTKAQICQTKWGTDRRFVSEKMKRHVLAAYGLTWEQRSSVEVDHLVPRSLGGADSILNLWAQTLSEAKHLKDRLEVRLHALVCADVLSLSSAQKAFTTDWRSAYVRYVGAFPVPEVHP